jgi:hypothetical protein
MLRVHNLRRLQRRLERALDESGNQRVPASRRRELHALSLELTRELSRLEQMPWPSPRSLAVRTDDRETERRLLPLLRAARSSQTYSPAGKL